MKKTLGIVFVVCILIIAIFKSNIDEYMDFRIMEKHRIDVNQVVKDTISEINKLQARSKIELKCIKKDIRNFSEFGFREYLPLAGKKFNGLKLREVFKNTILDMERIKKITQKRLSKVSGLPQRKVKTDIQQKDWKKNLQRKLQLIVDNIRFQKSFNINTKRVILIVDIASGLPIIKSVVAVVASDISLDFWLDHKVESSIRSIDSLHKTLILRLKRQVVADGFKTIQQSQSREINNQVLTMKV